jgi:hypothetical protein
MPAHLAAALTLMFPFPITAPAAGEVICTVGGIVSATTGGTVTLTVILAEPVLPARAHRADLQ